MLFTQVVCGGFKEVVKIFEDVCRIDQVIYYRLCHIIKFQKSFIDHRLLP